MMILMFALILSTCYGANSGQGRLIKKAQNEEKCYNASQYFGVYPSSRGENLWAAGLTINGEHEFLGNFTTEEKADQRVKKTIKMMLLKSLGLEHKIKDFTELEIDDVQYITVSDFPNFTDGELLEWFEFDGSDLEKWRKRYPDPENQPIVQEQDNTGLINAEQIQPEITTELSNDSVDENLEECDLDSVYDTDAGDASQNQRIESLKDCAKLEKWYSNPDIKYKEYMENIEKFDWERFLSTERDYPSVTESKDRLEISLAALKTFMEYKFLREDLTVGYNKVLFGSKELEDEFLADMKKIQPLQIYGKDLKGQPVVYADVTNGPNEWKALKNLVEETTENEPELGLKKLVYYKYVKVLQFIPDSRYLLVADATKAEDGLMTIYDRWDTVKTLQKAKKYELDMKMAYHKTDDEHDRYGVILFTKKGIPGWFPKRATTFIKNMAYDTYMHPEKQIQATLQNFIAKNQIPKNYNSEGKENIVWDSSEPQNFHEMNL